MLYRQLDPAFAFTGEKASGNLQAETIVVTGGSSGNKVVTEIIPEQGKLKN